MDEILNFFPEEMKQKIKQNLLEDLEEIRIRTNKPIILRNSDYNQRIAKAASIIEVGATGNTLDQCLVSMKYLAKVLSEI